MSTTTTTEPPQLQPPPQPPQPHRLSTSCDRHPDEHFTGFCPSCLCERLAVLDPNSNSAASSARKPPSITTSTAAAALKAIFRPSSNAASSSSSNKPPNSSSSFFPELRRTKSFSASKNEGFSGVFEPQRRSCDVRGRGNTLWSLFSQDDSERKHHHHQQPDNHHRVGPTSEIVELEPPRVSSSSLPRISTSSLPPPVFEEEEEEEEEEVEETHYIENGSLEPEGVPSLLATARNSNARPIEEIVEEEEEEEEDQIVIEPEEFLRGRVGVRVKEEQEDEVVVEEELKPMKDHIDLDTQGKKRDLKEIAGSFWSAASVFSKKLQKWRQKQKVKKQRREETGPGGGRGGGRLPVEKPIGRQFRETQSEVADYGFGRRSCDTDPRFSLDAGRMSFDDQPRYSFDEPRASWDGYMMAGRLSSSAFTKMPTMVEDYPVNVIASNINGIVNSGSSHSSNVVVRSDGQIPVEEEEDDDLVPGGSVQTRDYYLDSSSRRRRSLDRSNSIRKTAAAVVAEIDELKSVSSSKVLPAVAAADYLPGVKLVDRELKDLRDLRDSASMRDDCSESFEMGYGENGSVVGNGERKVGAKKSWRWGRGWSIWGLIHRRSINKDEDEDRYSRSNGVVERSFSESWPELRSGSNGDMRGGAFNPKLMRSNSSVSWRNSNGFNGVGSFSGSGRKSNVETNGHSSRKKKEEFVLERNRSARYSPSNIDNGMLRFYLTPLRGSRSGGWGKGKSNHAHSIARSVLRLY